jgi:hypothetical protein
MILMARLKALSVFHLHDFHQVWASLSLIIVLWALWNAFTSVHLNLAPWEESLSISLVSVDSLLSEFVQVIHEHDVKFVSVVLSKFVHILRSTVSFKALPTFFLRSKPVTGLTCLWVIQFLGSLP